MLDKSDQSTRNSLISGVRSVEMLKLFVVVLCAAAAVHAAEDVQYAEEDDFELRKYFESTYRKYIFFIQNFA